MGFEKCNEMVKKLKWFDMGLIKLSMFAFTLMLAKLWSPLLSLEWYWYGALFVLFVLMPTYRMFKK